MLGFFYTGEEEKRFFMDKLIRIGAFAKACNASISTVRYYVQCGYLIPERQNGQYLFDERCRKDMDQITMWKSMMFSLEEIHELLSFQRRYTYPLREDIEGYIAIYQRQLQRLFIHEEELNQRINTVRALMDNATGFYSSGQ